MWGGGLCSAEAGEMVFRHPAWLVLVMWSCPHCSLTSEFCIGAGAHHRAPQLGALSQAPSHTPSLPPRLALSHTPNPSMFKDNFPNGCFYFIACNKDKRPKVLGSALH